MPVVNRARAQTILPPLVGGLLILVALIGLIGTAIKNPQPHDIKVGLVGPTPVLEQMSTAFASNAPGAFQFTTYASEDAARAAIDDRSVDGALVLAAGGPRLIVAGAAGDAVTGVITGAFTNVFKAQGQTLTVETVHPFASADPHGLILFFVVLAVVVSTLVAMAGFGLRSQSGFGLRLIMVVVYAVLAALVGMGMARGWHRAAGGGRADPVPAPPANRAGTRSITRRWREPAGGPERVARGTRFWRRPARTSPMSASRARRSAESPPRRRSTQSSSSTTSNPSRASSSPPSTSRSTRPSPSRRSSSPGSMGWGRDWCAFFSKPGSRPRAAPCSR